MVDNKSDYVTMSELKDMMAIQGNAYKAATQMIIENIRSEIKSIRKTFEEFKVTIRLTSDKYDEISTKMRKIDDEIRTVYRQIEVPNKDVNPEIKTLENKQEYTENQSRRNNIKILGVEENEDEKTWADKVG